MDKLTIIEHNNQRILTTQQVAEFYGTEPRRITENFRSNYERYDLGKSHYLIGSDELREFKNRYGISVVDEKANSLYLWTEKGCFLHAKSLNTDKAWDVYNELVDTYFRVQQIMTPKLLIATALIEAQKMLEEKDRQIEELIPAAEFGNAIGSCADGILMRDFAKLLANDGIRIGQDGLFTWLCEKGYIFRDQSSDDWRPRQRFVDQGLFNVRETKYTTKTRGEKLSITMRVTGKGQKYFFEKLRQIRLVMRDNL